MKMLTYYLLVFFVSFEFLVICIAGFFSFIWTGPVDTIIGNLTLSSETIKYMSLLPGVLAVWIFKESKEILFPGEAKDKLFHQWSGYRKLKAHFNVTLFYATIFAIFAVLPWLFKIEVKNIFFFPFYASSVLGQFIVAYSVYAAQVAIKERLIKIDR